MTGSVLWESYAAKVKKASVHLGFSHDALFWRTNLYSHLKNPSAHNFCLWTSISSYCQECQCFLKLLVLILRTFELLLKCLWSKFVCVFAYLLIQELVWDPRYLDCRCYFLDAFHHSTCPYLIHWKYHRHTFDLLWTWEQVGELFSSSIFYSLTTWAFKCLLLNLWDARSEFYCQKRRQWLKLDGAYLALTAQSQGLTWSLILENRVEADSFKQVVCGFP